MVDERVVIPGVNEGSRLVTLTTDESLKYKIADVSAGSLTETLKAFNLDGAKIIEKKSNWAEDLVKILNNPVVSSILIIIGLIGIFMEIKAPGLSFPGIMGVLALALFFGSSYILQLASVIEIVLFVVGIILLILEIFVIPGFGFAGIAGIILVISSLFFSLISAVPIFDFSSIAGPIVQLTVSLLLVVVLFYSVVKYLPKSDRFNNLVLETEAKASKGFVSNPKYDGLLNLSGIALTDLRPAGMAEINGKRVDVVTDGGYIEKGSKIIVIKTEGAGVVVKQLKA
jgi:membrane-bound serine protease (ClpP class)